jgi:hypothetical protein
MRGILEEEGIQDHQSANKILYHNCWGLNNTKYLNDLS